MNSGVDNISIESFEFITDFRVLANRLLLLIALLYIHVKENVMNNRNTTFAGIGAILVALGALAKAFFDNDPTTTPDFAAAVAAVIAGVGLIFAKDASNNTPPTTPTK